WAYAGAAPNHRLTLQHRKVEQAARASKLNERRLHRIVQIPCHRLYVGYLNYLLGFQHAPKACIGSGTNQGRASSGLGVFERRAVQGHSTKRIFLVEPKVTELCTA